MDQSNSKFVSKFEQKQQRRQAELDARVAEYKAVLAKLSEEQLEQHRIAADNVLAELEETRKLDRIIAHIDMDAFFASVEIRDRPELAERPIAVGSKSMLSTANYAARKFGVRSGMPGFKALNICPDLLIVTSNFDKYGDASAQVRRVLERYDPNLEHFMDEAYLDLTAHVQQRMSESNSHSANTSDANAEVRIAYPADYSPTPQDRFVAQCVAEIRAQVLAETQLTCSSGIGVNCMLAKLCTDMNKPNGQFYLPPVKRCIVNFIQQQKVGKVCGIGPVTERTLNGLGVKTVRDLFDKRAELHALFAEPNARASRSGSSWSPFQFYMQLALGLGSTELSSGTSERKSLSVERTFTPTDNVEQMCDTLLLQCEEVLQDLRKKRLAGRTVTVKVKLDNFDVCTRGQTVDKAFGFPDDDLERQKERLFAVAKNLFRAELARRSSGASAPIKVRLLGLRVSNLHSEEDESAPVGNSQPLITDLLGLHKLRGDQKRLQRAADCCALQDECSNSNIDLQDTDSRSRFDILEESSRFFDDDSCSQPAVLVQDSPKHLKVQCPVCFTAVCTDDQLVQFNCHVDDCLSKASLQSTDAQRNSPTSTCINNARSQSTKRAKKRPALKKTAKSASSCAKKDAIASCGGPLDRFLIPCIEIDSDSPSESENQAV